MNFMGLSRKYAVNRLLTKSEKDWQLRQRTRLNVEPHYQLSVIKMNSTFLESVDKWYGWKGVMSCVAIVAIGMLGVFYCAMLFVSLARKRGVGDVSSDLSIMLMVTLMVVPVAIIVIWTLFRESFAYTHYPIRFNRKNREVHVFQLNGTVLTAKWNEIFFTLGELQYDQWEVRGHMLAPDKETVIHTFALSYIGSVSPESINSGNKKLRADDYVHAHWEFIRRYMEDGPQNLVSQVQFCIPVDARRETVYLSFERMFANIAGAPQLLYWMESPIFLLFSLFRIFAMRTSKLPKWTAEVEAACAIEPDDPYAIEGTLEGDRKAVFPQAAKAAGV